MKRIKIDTRHLGDIWRLPCIRKAYKDDNGKTYIIFSDGRRNVRLTDGDGTGNKRDYDATHSYDCPHKRTKRFKKSTQKEINQLCIMF